MKQIIVDNQVTNYSISEDGKCYNNKTKKYLKGQISNSGYLNFNLTLPDGKKRRLYAHRLVAIAFIPNKNLDATYVNHIDGNKMNNCTSNLEWVTAKENANHAIETGLINIKKEVYVFDKDTKTIVAHFFSVNEAAKKFNLHPTSIQMELTNKIHTPLGGYYWSHDSFLTDVKEYVSTGKSKTVYQYDLEGNFLAEYESTGRAAKAVGMKKGTHIGECCRGRVKTCKGYIWKYKDDIV